MFEGSETVEKILKYVEKVFPNNLPEEWRVSAAEYVELAKRAVMEMSAEATKGRRLVRIAGRSGSGKTTQLLPAVKAWFGKDQPVVVAAREFVKYHPHLEEILHEYGESGVREMTDGFASLMIFLSLKMLTEAGFDIILDLSLVNAEMEKILIMMLTQAKYKTWMTMMAVPKEVAEKRLQQRNWRHGAEGEAEFAQATEASLRLYAEMLPEMRVVIWGMSDLTPAYDGPVGDAFDVFKKKEGEVAEEVEVDKLVATKIEHFRH